MFESVEGLERRRVRSKEGFGVLEGFGIGKGIGVVEVLKVVES